MTDAVFEEDGDVDQWWFWFAVALFLLLPLDLLTTLFAVAKHGIAVEANPIVRWLLQQGLVAVTVAHLLVVGLVVSLFHGAVERIRRVPPSDRRVLVHGVNLWIGILIVSGVVLVLNNLLALV